MPRKKWGQANSLDKRDVKLVSIDESWTLLETIEINHLQTLHADYEAPVDLVATGTPFVYDKTFDKISSKAERVLDKSFRKVKKIKIEKDKIVSSVRYNPNALKC